MAKATNTAATTAPATSSIYDFDDLPSTESSTRAQITDPGIVRNLKPSISFTTGKFKEKDTNIEHMWKGFQLVLVDPNNLEFTEVYFAPPDSEKDVKYMQKKYELVDGRTVETREATPLETLRILNNEFIAYLLDLGEAFGFKNTDIREHIQRNATSFENICNAFISKFKPAENKRIEAKILYDNNKKQGKSFLKIHGSFPKYYPYGNDFFDTYVEGKPTNLKLSKWEMENGLVKKYTGTADAPKNNETLNKAGGFKPIKTEGDVDPF